jgi:hypothetical protein
MTRAWSMPGARHEMRAPRRPQPGGGANDPAPGPVGAG